MNLFFYWTNHNFISHKTRVITPMRSLQKSAILSVCEPSLRGPSRWHREGGYTILDQCKPTCTLFDSHPYCLALRFIVRFGLEWYGSIRAVYVAETGASYTDGDTAITFIIIGRFTTFTPHLLNLSSVVQLKRWWFLFELFPFLVFS